MRNPIERFVREAGVLDWVLAFSPAVVASFLAAAVGVKVLGEVERMARGARGARRGGR